MKLYAVTKTENHNIHTVYNQPASICDDLDTAMNVCKSLVESLKSSYCVLPFIVINPQIYPYAKDTSFFDQFLRNGIIIVGNAVYPIQGAEQQ